MLLGVQQHFLQRLQPHFTVPRNILIPSAKNQFSQQLPEGSFYHTDLLPPGVDPMLRSHDGCAHMGTTRVHLTEGEKGMLLCHGFCKPESCEITVGELFENSWFQGRNLSVIS